MKLVIVKSLTFDGAPDNISMVKKLGAKLLMPNIEPYFEHPITKHKIHVLLDPCHMLKLCQNTLNYYKIIFLKTNQ